MTRPFDDRTADALLGGRAVEGEPELSAFVADLTALAEAAPTPSPALAELLEHGISGVAAPVTAPAVVRRRWTAPLWARAVTAGALALTGVLSAAAANALPGRAQNAVADVVGWVTSVQLPHADHGGPAPAPSPSATTTPAPQSTPGSTPGTPAPGGDHGGSAGDSTTGGSAGSHDGSPGSGDGTSGGSGGDITTGGSDSGSTGGASVPGGSDGGSPGPSPTTRSDETPTPTPSASPSDGGSGGSDGH